MLEIAIFIRCLYFLKHNCHNLVFSSTFFQDHDFLGKSYETSLEHYDSVIERLIGLNGQPNLVELQQKALDKLKSIPIKYKNNEECFYFILDLNRHIISLIEEICNKTTATEGTKQLLGGIADEIEIENYKLKQRLKK